MYLKTLEICVLKYIDLILQIDLLTDIDRLLMVEKGIRGGICRSIYRYTKANNRYMNDYHKNKESLYVQY